MFRQRERLPQRRVDASQPCILNPNPPLKTISPNTKLASPILSPKTLNPKPESYAVSPALTSFQGFRRENIQKSPVEGNECVTTGVVSGIVLYGFTGSWCYEDSCWGANVELPS